MRPEEQFSPIFGQEIPDGAHPGDVQGLSPGGELELRPLQPETQCYD